MTGPARNISGHFADILDTMYHAVVACDQAGRIILFNAAAEQLFLRNRKQTLEQSLDILIPAAYRDSHPRQMAGFSQGHINARLMGNRSEISCLRADGTVFPGEASILKTDTDGQTVYTAIIRDLTERKQWEADLQLALQHAESANRVKANLLASLSHELRTPLNAILGFSEALLSGLVGPMADERQESYLKDIRMSGQHLLELVSDLLDMSSVEAGGRDLDIVSDDLEKTIENALALANGGQASHARTQINIAQKNLLVWADRSALRQILVNILSNAFRYTPTTGLITIEALTLSLEWVEVRVIDTGPGIPQEDLAHVFEPFYRGRDADKADHRGIGVGLPIAKTLIERMNGSLSISSMPGLGTTMKLRLRRAAAAPDSKPVMPLANYRTG